MNFAKAFFLSFIIFSGTPCFGMQSDRTITAPGQATTQGRIFRDKCAICRENFNEAPAQGEEVVLSCGHTFHTACIIPSLEVNQACPMCRQKINNEEFRRINPALDLYYAAGIGELTVAREALAKGARINALIKTGNSNASYFFPLTKKESPLHHAIRNGETEMARYLLDNGATVEILDSIGNTPLHRAAEAKQIAGVRLLLERGANPNARIATNQNRTLLHLTTSSDFTEIANALIQGNADVNALDSVEQTPLHFAVHDDNLVLVRLLLAKGINDVNARGRTGTPLDLAAVRGNTEMAELLLDNGAHIDCTQRHLTPVHFAALAGSKPMLELLFNRNPRVVADQSSVGNQPPRLVDLTANFGDGIFNVTPLHFAAMSGCPEAVKFLLEKNASVKKRALFDSPHSHPTGFNPLEFLSVKYLVGERWNEIFRTLGMTHSLSRSQADHEKTTDLLLAHGATLGRGPATLALYSAVREGRLLPLWFVTKAIKSSIDEHLQYLE